MKAMTMHEAINAGFYYRVSLPQWASGGMDIVAESARAAALAVGCLLESWGGRNRPDCAEVHKHLRGSSIGCAFLESAGTHETLTADHYSI